jgi:hypothetical protein
MRLMRGGNYNQFWLLGQHHPLEGHVGDELGARVLQGDGLLIAGGDPGFDLFNLCGDLSPLGATFAGALPPSSYRIKFAAGSSFAGLDAQVGGMPIKVTTTQATAIGTTTYSSTSHPKTAITATYNQFGQGKTIYIGSSPKDFSNQASAAAVIKKAADVLLPAAEGAHAGGLARLSIFVEGVAPGSPLEMRTQLPAGTGAPQHPDDVTLADGLLTVPFAAEGTQHKERGVWLKLPTSGSSASTSSRVYYRDAADGRMKAYGDPVMATVGISENKQQARDATLAALDQIGNVPSYEQWRLQDIRHDASVATSQTDSTYLLWTRLHELVNDIGTLERTRWTNTAPARVAVARLVTYVEYDYYLAGGN